MEKKGKFDSQIALKLTHQVMGGNHYLNLCATALGGFLEPILITPEQWRDIESRFVVFSEPLSGIDRIMSAKNPNPSEDENDNN